jgi:hypothetical protein
MNTSETGRLDVGHDIRTLRDGELDAVSGSLNNIDCIDLNTVVGRYEGARRSLLETDDPFYLVSRGR